MRPGLFRWACMIAVLLTLTGCGAVAPVRPSPTTVASPSMAIPSVTAVIAATATPVLPTSLPGLVSVTAMPATGSAPLLVTFQVVSSGPLVHVALCTGGPGFDFGDGTRFIPIMPACAANDPMRPSPTPLSVYRSTKTHLYTQAGMYRAWAFFQGGVAETTVTVR